VIRALQDHLDTATTRRDFKEGAVSLRALEAAQAHMKDLLKKRLQQDALADVAAKRKEAQRKYARFCQIMDAKERELEQGLQEQVQRMEERQREECAMHDRSWRRGRKKRLFNRSSQKVRGLRLEQQLLLASCRFEEAAEVRSIADRQVQEEALESHYKMFCSFAESRALLEKKHAEEMKILKTANETRRAELRGLREKLAIKYENRFTTLAAQEEDVTDPDRFWNRKHRGGGTRGSETSRTVIPGLTFARLPVMGTARSVRQSAMTPR
jgi:hypothetical protein